MSEEKKDDHRQSGDFTEEEGRIHQAGFKVIHQGLSRGLSFDEACAGLQVVDPELRRVIIDDYLKVTIAERHFQSGESLEEVAGSLKVPVERVEEARQSMLLEVQQSAAQVYRKQAGDAGFDMEKLDGGGKDKKLN